MEFAVWKHFLVYGYAVLCGFLLINHFAPAVSTRIAQLPTLAANHGQNLKYPAEKIVYVWTTIYQEFEKEFFYQHVNAEQYFDSHYEEPDYDTDTYFVPKHRKYCLANFLYNVMNNKENLSKKRLFFDYAPNNALKKELGKTFTLANKNIYETYVSKRTLEERKTASFDPKISVMYTKPSLYYNMVIGKHYNCGFQMVNHIPGEGKLTRPDLLATIIKDHQQGDDDIKVDVDFYPHTYRLYVKEECENYFNLINDASFKELLKSNVYFIKKDIVSKKETKLSYFEDHNLNSLYKRGQMCGKKMRGTREIIQKYISDQTLLENKYRFRLRAYMFVSSFDPLVAHYHDGELILDVEDGSFVDKFKKYQALEEDLIKRGLTNGPKDFKLKIMEQIKRIVRTGLFLSKDHFLKDSRGFQLFAFDMLLDKDLKVWLIDVKNAPLLRLQHKDMVVQMLDYTHQLVESRNSKLHDFFRKLYGEIVTLVKQGVLEIEDHEAFVVGLKNHFIFKRERDQLRAAMKYYSDYVKIHPDFELIYDGRIGNNLLSSPALEIERFKLKLKYNRINRV